MSKTMTSFGIASAVLLSFCFSTANAQISFSLDNNPSAPIGPVDPPGLIPGFGAEDPFGLGLVGAGLAPSPSLGVLGLGDGMILSPGIALQHPGPNGFFLSSLSTNRRRATTQGQRMAFSIDRISFGMPGSASLAEGIAGQQPGDIYRTKKRLLNPALLAGTLGPGFNGPLPSAGGGGTNVLRNDDSGLGLLTSAGIVPPGAPVPPPFFGSHDNIDALEMKVFDSDFDGLFDRAGYFTIYPDEAVAVGTSASDIYAVAVTDFGAIPVPYAPSGSMGLDSFGFNTDAIDALVMYDHRLQPVPAFLGGPGFVEPVIDYALFSLAPGSASLAGFGLSPADIFFTDFTGGFGVYAFASDIGLGFPDNVDALSIIPEPSGAVLMMIGVAGLTFRRKRRS